MIYEVHDQDLTISTDQSKLDLRLIHAELKHSYWSPNIPYKTVIKALKHSLCFGVYKNNQQIAFARLVTDYTSFAYLADVFVIKAEQGKGVGKALLKAILNHPDVEQIRRLMLATWDAHELYRQFGFSELSDAEIFMQIVKDDAYRLPS